MLKNSNCPYIIFAYGYRMDASYDLYNQQKCINFAEAYNSCMNHQTERKREKTKPKEFLQVKIIRHIIGIYYYLKNAYSTLKCL